jgi:hypothetical protein
MITASEPRANRRGSDAVAFELRDADLRMVMSSGSSTGARRGGRIEVTVIHKPTGISVTGEAPPVRGGRTRAQAKAAKEDLTRRLRRELADEVATHLRIPGR